MVGCCASSGAGETLKPHTPKDAYVGGVFGTLPTEFLFRAARRERVRGVSKVADL